MYNYEVSVSLFKAKKKIPFGVEVVKIAGWVPESVQGCGEPVDYNLILSVIVGSMLAELTVQLYNVSRLVKSNNNKGNKQ